MPKCKPVFALIFDKVLSPQAFNDLGLNPWQMFLPQDRVMHFGVSEVPWFPIGGMEVFEPSGLPHVREGE